VERQKWLSYRWKDALMNWFTFMLELVKAIISISWPIVVLVLAYSFGKTFRVEIAHFIRNIASVHR